MTDAASEIGLNATTQRGTRRRFAIFGSLLLILVAAGSALYLVQGVDRQLQDVVRTYEVRKQARDLVLGLLEAESAQRGYLLTLDQLYLEPFNAALAGTDARLNTLLELTEADPSQRSRIAGVVEEIQQKKAEMTSTIALAASDRTAAAQAVVESNTGLRLMDQVRNVVDAFIAQEDELLVGRNAVVESSRIWLVVAVLAALAGAATLTYFLFNRSQAQVSALARKQSALLSENVELEQHVRARTVELEEARSHAERERERVETLLQDTNHRIGNSLSTVSSLLALQMLRTPSEEVKTALEAARSRVHAIASGHRRLRLGADMETTRADDFLAAVVEDFRATQPNMDRIEVHTDFDGVTIPARDATTIGIVLGELVTNALKHAFPDSRSGQIWCRLVRGDDGHLKLSVSDDGQGMGDSRPGQDGGLGSTIIQQLAQQFGGDTVYAPREGGGTLVTVNLPDLQHRVD